MGLGHIDAIARLLIARGWNALTPAAVLFAASTPGAAVGAATIAELQHGLDVADRADTGTIVIGDVVRLRAALAEPACSCAEAQA
jgi:siroheme synthase